MNALCKPATKASLRWRQTRQTRQPRKTPASALTIRRNGGSETAANNLQRALSIA
jgi:hypothetical protein